jgi:predicted amidohydrolase
MTYDLILRGGRVVDPSQDFDAVADVAFADGKVAAVGKDIATDDSIDVRDVGMGSFASRRRGPCWQQILFRIPSRRTSTC